MLEEAQAAPNTRRFTFTYASVSVSLHTTREHVHLGTGQRPHGASPAKHVSTRLERLLAGQSDEPLPIPRTSHGAIGCMTCGKARRKARTGSARRVGGPVILTACERHEPKQSKHFVFAVRFA
jgi:hypothetical protein